MKQFVLILLSLFVSGTTFSQIISGNLSLLSNQEIRLDGFSGLKTYPIATAKIDGTGNFKVAFSKTDYGFGYLKTADEKTLFVILSDDNIELTGESLLKSESLKINKGRENQLYNQYVQEHPNRERALSAWGYLEKLYTTDPIFSKQFDLKRNIQNEEYRINEEDRVFLSKLPKDSYISWFLPIRKLVSSAPSVAQYHAEEIPATIAAFRNIDYTDNRLYKSGLFKDAIDNHFWLLENSGKPLDKVFEEMAVSIDSMQVHLVKDENKFNEVTKYLFELLEKHSLFKASEYLAIKALNDKKCNLEANLARQLESYRTMKNGNTAPDIIFDKNLFVNPTQTINTLSDLKSKYTVVVFGASWCPGCAEELPEISKLYDKWKSKDVEVIFIALEEDKKSFTDFAKLFPFPSYSELNKWDNKIVRDYCVFSTPTLFLLDNKREIILKPNSVKHLEAWFDWFLVQGAK